jgi:protein TonB
VHDRPISGNEISTATNSSTLIAQLLGEEKPSNMLSLLSILVVLIHIYALMWFFAPEEKFTPAQALQMEVSMVTISAPKPQVAPPKPVEPPKKPLPKPIIKKAPAIVQKSPDFAPVEPVSPPQPAPPAAASPAPAAPAAPAVEHFTEANFKANYLTNPKPEYPSIAKSRGWTGKVMLRVQVSPEGTANAVEVETSSGHEMLDEAAVEAVKKWKFIPAKKGETAVASAVIVPIVFSLRD